MFKKNRFLISQIIVFLFFPNLTLYASNEEYLNCQGIYWSNKEAQFAEWKIIKRVSTYKIYFEIILQYYKIKNKNPIICGGSGLYYRAIQKGIFKGSISNLKKNGYWIYGFDSSSNKNSDLKFEKKKS